MLIRRQFLGLVGFGMRVLDVPVAPCIVGLILGPLAEQQFRRALAISQGGQEIGCKLVAGGGDPAKVL